MKNPYIKQQYSEDRAKHFTRSCTDRWAFFEVSKGLLWSSANRRKFTYAYCRDYCEEICERWARIHKRYLPLYEQDKLVQKISKRDNWPVGRELTRFIFQTKIFPWRASGKFTLVSFFKHENGKRKNVKCSLCGAPAIADRGEHGEDTIFYKKHEDDGDVFGYDTYIERCSNSMCKEVFLYFNNKGDSVERAKKAGVPLNRPVGTIKDINDQSDYVIVAAALLDMEARTMKKQKLLEQP